MLPVTFRVSALPFDSSFVLLTACVAMTSYSPARLFSPCPSPNPGRGGGIRTPIPGFGDRSPDRWTTPLYREPASAGEGLSTALLMNSDFFFRLQPFSFFSRARHRSG